MEGFGHLGFKVSCDELRDAFDQVDMDKTGLVDVHEFKTAVKDNVTLEHFSPPKNRKSLENV